MDLIASEAGCAAGDILGHDLYLYVRGRGTIWGARNEFLSAGHLDDLLCGFADLKAFLAAGKHHISHLVSPSSRSLTTKRSAPAPDKARIPDSSPISCTGSVTTSP